MFGLLNLNKPRGLTSRDVVNQVQRLVKPQKTGHAGTLDPLATGVLVVCVGPATRLIEYVQRLPKRYLAEFLLGRHSTTEDTEGAIELLPDPPIPSREDLAAVLPRFLGEIQQMPPAYSALKLQGKRAYELARQGAHVELAPRPVQIHELTLLSFDYPRFTLDIRCGSGTYVRSLGRDIARALGTEAVMSALERVEIGPFQVTDAVAPDSLTSANLANHLRSPRVALANLPPLTLQEQEFEHLCHGRTIANRFQLVTEGAAFTVAGELVAIVQPTTQDRLQPTLCFFQRQQDKLP